MKVRLIWIGKTRNPPLAQLIDDFLGRLRRIVPVEVVEIRDPKAGNDKVHYFAAVSSCCCL